MRRTFSSLLLALAITSCAPAETNACQTIPFDPNQGWSYHSLDDGGYWFTDFGDETIGYAAHEDSPIYPDSSCL